MSFGLMKRQPLLLITAGYVLLIISVVYWLDYRGWLHLDFLGLTPISLYGKVVDEKGNTVPGAKVDYSCDSGNDQTTTDQSGLFHASGLGMSIHVMVSKPGYYHFQDSEGTFGYSNLWGKESGHPDSNHPAVLVLRKAGTPARLEVNGIGGNFSVDPSPKEFNLRSGEYVPPGQGDLKLELWTDDQNEDSNYHFDWRLRISIRGSGLVERTGEFDFEAPATGYQQTVEIDMPKSLGYKWNRGIEKDYFIKLADGTYGRIHLDLSASGGKTFTGVCYLNPQPGSRNLEYRKEPDDF